MNMNVAALVVIALLAGLAIGAAVIYFLQRSRTVRLQERFGPEYARTVADKGDRWKAESDLERRQRRVQRLHIRQLEPARRSRFEEAWRDIQARFVDSPQATVTEADRLIMEVMSEEGYPVEDFEQQAADISVEHPRVVDNYREGHAIAVRQGQGRADTEDLRRAMIHYRALFEDLLGQGELARTEGRA